MVNRERPTHPETDPITALYISYADCVADGTFLFDIATTTPTLGMEVWATSQGTDCKTTEERRGDDESCGFVTRNDSEEQLREIRVPVRAIVSALLLTTDTTGAAACDEFIETFSGDDAGFDVTLHFMSMPPGGGNVPAENATTWVTKIDMIGPPAPTDVSAGSGESKLILNWDVETTQDTEGFRFYCDPAPGSAAGLNDLLQAGGSAGMAGATSVGGAAGAATGGMAGATSVGGAAGAATGGGAGAPSGADCGSGVLVAGTIPSSMLDAYRCGGVTGATAADATTDALANNTEYAVAISGVDALGNVGPLSDIDCGTPVLVDDFYERYRLAGGQGGGGFCALGAGRAHGFSATLALGFAAWWLRRRQRRRSCRP